MEHPCFHTPTGAPGPGPYTRARRCWARPKTMHRRTWQRVTAVIIAFTACPRRALNAERGGGEAKRPSWGRAPEKAQIRLVVESQPPRLPHKKRISRGRCSSTSFHPNLAAAVIFFLAHEQKTAAAAVPCSRPPTKSIIWNHHGAEEDRQGGRFGGGEEEGGHGEAAEGERRLPPAGAEQERPRQGICLHVGEGDQRPRRAARASRRHQGLRR